MAAADPRVPADHVDRPNEWITWRPEQDLLTEATDIQRGCDNGEHPPLAAILLAVKDNIGVADLATTAGWPSDAYAPRASATAVRRLTGAVRRTSGCLVPRATPRG